MSRYYLDQTTILCAWDGTADTTELGELLAFANDGFYTSVIAPARALEELERTSPKRVKAAVTEYNHFFVKVKAQIKRASVHEMIMSTWRSWEERAQRYHFVLPFHTGIELATADFLKVHVYLSNNDDEKFLAFVKQTTSQFKVVRASSVYFQREMYEADSVDPDNVGNPADNPDKGPTRNPSLESSATDGKGTVAGWDIDSELLKPKLKKKRKKK